jgi:hypothetical protein
MLYTKTRQNFLRKAMAKKKGCFANDDDDYDGKLIKR